MFRTAIIWTATTLVAVPIGLGACSSTDSAGVQDASAPLSPQVSAPPALGQPSTDPCGDMQFEVATVRDLQNGTFPADGRGAAQRIASFAQNAPIDVRPAAQGAAGPALMVLRYHDVNGMEDTGAVNEDLRTLDDWRSANC